MVGQPVFPVSVLHSNQVDPALLDGRPAVIFEQAVRQAKADGIDLLVALPLFIGPSRALTEFLPKVFVDADPGPMKLSIRPALFGDDGLELLDLLVDNLKDTGWTKGSGTVLLCDHGSPIPEVTACRDKLAAALRQKLGLKPTELVACSMERRDGPAYAFNEPLLQDALAQSKGDVAILMLFLLPGRHAGPDGDVATIAKEHAPAGVRWKTSPLLGEHRYLPILLGMRLTSGPRPPASARRAMTLFLLALFLLVFLFGMFLPAPWNWPLIVGLALLCTLPPLLLWARRRRRN